MEIDKKIIAEKINIARKSRTGYVFKNLFPDTPSWDQFINHLNYEYNNENQKYYDSWINSGYFESKEYEQYGEILKNGAIFYKNKELYVSCSIKDPLKFYPQAENPQILFQEILGDSKAKFGQTFINFVSNKDQIAMHIDQRETIFWLCQGKVTWILGDPEDWNKITRYDLEAGDIMFAPWGLPHTVESHSPRAGMVFSAHFQDFDYLDRLNNQI